MNSSPIQSIITDYTFFLGLFAVVVFLWMQ